MSERARGVIRVTLADAATAAAVARALEPENAGFVTQHVDAEEITAEADADGTMALLRTLDDWLACFTAAEQAAGAGRAGSR